MWRNFNNKLIFLTIVSVLILAIAFALNFSYSQKEIMEHQTYDYLLDTANYTKVVLHSEIKKQNELLDILVKNIPLYEEQPDKLIELLNTVSYTGSYSRSGLTYRGEKTLLCYGDEADIRGTNYYKKALAGETVIEAPLISLVNGKKIVALAKPFYKDGEIAGVVHETYDLETAAETLLAGLNIREDRSTMLANAGGVIIMGVPNNNKDNVFDFLQENAIVASMPKRQLQSMMAAGERGAFHYTDLKGGTQYVVFMPAEVNDWYIFQVVSGTSLLTDQHMLNKIAQITMGKYFLLLGLCFLVIIYIWRQLGKERLKQLNAEIDGLRLTAGLIEGWMFEFDLKTRKFLLIRNTGSEIAMTDEEQQVMDTVGNILAEVILEKNDSSLSSSFHPDDLEAVRLGLKELQDKGRIVFQGRLHKKETGYQCYRFYMTSAVHDKGHIKRILGNILAISDNRYRFSEMQFDIEQDKKQ